MYRLPMSLLCTNRTVEKRLYTLHFLKRGSITEQKSLIVTEKYLSQN